MSGGALDYKCYTIEDLANMIEEQSNDPLHREFAAHLKMCAKAAHALEWVLSGDYSPGDEVKLLRAVLDGQKKATTKEA